MSDPTIRVALLVGGVVALMLLAALVGGIFAPRPSLTVIIGGEGDDGDDNPFDPDSPDLFLGDLSPEDTPMVANGRT